MELFTLLLHNKIHAGMNPISSMGFQIPAVSGKQT